MITGTRTLSGGKEKVNNCNESCLTVVFMAKLTNYMQVKDGSKISNFFSIQAGKINLYTIKG